ncbi:hypothetical protein SAMN04488107_0665 [Geodermatophilus saharensis]|uniref:ATP/GTP-binding protein n=1 Tax=Geodermatophilus saharensis TaxID=1137994 RepID=A0A239AA69_9ACTN|nr:hypothetical protein SAMN04488107_0665 [Geodermatophilus saharensis]
MARRGRRTGGGRPGSRPPLSARPERVEEAGDGDWVVRSLTGAASTKPYRCPGCDQEIRPGTPHLVTWPAYARDSDLDPWDTDSAADLRRHWHAACWRARDRRR